MFKCSFQIYLVLINAIESLMVFLLCKNRQVHIEEGQHGHASSVCGVLWNPRELM